MREEKRTLNILIVHNYYQISGGEDTVVANEMEMLKEHGHQVYLYSRNNSELNNMNLIQKCFLPVNTIFNVKTYQEIKQLIRRHQIDIVHVHNTLNLISPSVYYAAKKCGIPVVQTIHNFRLLCPGATFYRDGHICEDCVGKGLLCAVKHNCYRGSKLQTLACVISTWIHRTTGIYGRINYICLTEFNKNKLLRIRQIKSEHVYVKPNSGKGIGACIPENEREKRFVYAGRLDQLKGIPLLFEAWKLMGKDAPKLIVCGDGPLKSWCEEFVAKNDVNIDLKGFMPNQEVFDLVAHSKALILPTQWYEGFPMSIVEAFSAGTPVVCSDIGNAGSIVEEGVNGCKFDRSSAQELIDAINRCDGLSESTYDIFKVKYEKETNYQQLINIYCRVTK